jgi:hypothetical protein
MEFAALREAEDGPSRRDLAESGHRADIVDRSKMTHLRHRLKREEMVQKSVDRGYLKGTDIHDLSFSAGCSPAASNARFHR